MCDILGSMFDNIVVYVWMDCTDDGDGDHAILLRAEDVDKAKEFTEYISDKREAESFSDFLHLLDNEDIEYYDISDSVDIFEFEPEAGE
jgi:hypothetical protein